MADYVPRVDTGNPAVPGTITKAPYWDPYPQYVADMEIGDQATIAINTQLPSLLSLQINTSGSPLKTLRDDVNAIMAGGGAGSLAWSAITGKPTTFTPTAHVHAASDITSGIIAVAQGGTGLSSFTNNTFVTANSTTTLQTAKAVPAGAVVGTTDAQTLTNKTLTSPVLNSPTGLTSAAISDFTEATQDAVAALFAAGTQVGIVYTYDDNGNKLSATVSGGGGSFDAEMARDTIGAALAGVGNIAVAVDDANDTITISTTATVNSTDAALRDRSTHTGVQAQSTITNLVTDLAGKEPLLPTGGNASQFITGAKTLSNLNKFSVGLGSVDNVSAAALRDRSTHTGTQDSTTISDFTEASQDAIAALLTAGSHTGITFSYDDANNQLSAVVTVSGGGGGSTAIPLTYRGVAAGSTTYNPGDVVVYRGGRIMITTAVTTGAVTPPATPFISAGNYFTLVPFGMYYAADWGVIGDGTNDQLAKINSCLSYVQNTTGGGTVILPAGLIMISGEIDLPSQIRLVGQGISPSGTCIKLLPNSNSNGIKFHTSTGSGNSNAFWGGLEDMQIHGNRWSQGLTTFHHGINVTTNPTSTAQTGDPDFDPAHHFKNLILKNWTGHGFFHQGRSDLFLSSIHSKDNFGSGFYLSFDTRVVGCTAGFNGVCGFWYQGSSVQTTATKSYNNGKHAFWATGVAYAVGTYVMHNGALYRATTSITTTDNTVPGTDATKWTLVWADAPWGTGFAVRGNHLKEIVFSACDAQQNSGSGLDFRQSSVVFQGTVTQPNFDNVGSTSAVLTTNARGYASVLLDGAHECIIDVLSNGTSSVTPHLRVINTLVNSELRIVGDPSSLLKSADSINIATGGSRFSFNGMSQTYDAIAGAAPGTMFVCPLNGTVNTSTTTARPSSRTDIFFTWRTTVEPTNALPGDEIIFQDA